MKLCPKCNHSPWPFVMVFVIASISAFLTWLTLGLSVSEVAPRAAGSALAFATVGGTLLHYILSCFRRHCRHSERVPQPSVPVQPPVSRRLAVQRQG